MADKGHSNGSKFCDQEKGRQGFQNKKKETKTKMPNRGHSNVGKISDQKKGRV